MQKKYKSGKITVEEIDFIKKNKGTMSDADMAKTLNRTLNFIRVNRHDIEYAGDSNDDCAQLIIQLRKKHFWKDILAMLTTNEVRFFEKQWAQIVMQFGISEVLATDDIGIKDLVILEICANRALISKKKCLDEISRLEDWLEMEMAKPPLEQNMNEIATCRTKINDLYPALTALTTEYIKYQEKKDMKFKDLKATREQRFKQEQNSRHNFFDMIKELDTYAKRKQEGDWNYKMQLGAKKVEEEWAANDFKYADGEYGRVFLSPEYMEKEKDEEEDKK